MDLHGYPDAFFPLCIDGEVIRRNCARMQWFVAAIRNQYALNRDSRTYRRTQEGHLEVFANRPLLAIAAGNDLVMRVPGDLGGESYARHWVTQYQKRCPSTELKTYPDATHFLPYEHAAQLTADITAFLK